MDSADEVFREMHEAGVLHYTNGDGAKDTAWGTREVDTLDLDDNLLTFVERVA